MTEDDMATSHLEPARADAARRAVAALLEAAAVWTAATKHHVGAVAVPGDRAGAQAFDAFFASRRELARHVGGAVAAQVAAAAMTEAARSPRPAKG